MKGIGIEKLGELLREYSYKNHDYHWTIYVSGEVEGSVPGTDHDLSNEEMGMVIKSKEYGFIKWLVENDKIKDLEEIDYIYGPELVNHQTEIIYTPYSLYESLLMLLSISDTPIEFLVSILK